MFGSRPWRYGQTDPGSGCSSRGLESASRRIFPGLNRTFRRAGTKTSAPVLGFRALGRAFVFLTSQLPNPRISILSPSTMASASVSNRTSTACLANVFLQSRSSARIFARSALVMVCTRVPPHDGYCTPALYGLKIKRYSKMSRRFMGAFFAPSGIGERVIKFRRPKRGRRNFIAPGFDLVGAQGLEPRTNGL